MASTKPTGNSDPTTYWWGKFDERTADLTMAEYGAFRLLCNYYYTYSELPVTLDELAVIARAATPADKAALLSTISKRFVHDGSRYRNADVEQMIARRNVMRNKYDMRAAAKQSGLELAAVSGPVRRGPGRPKMLSVILPDTDPTTMPLPPWVPRELWLVWVEFRRVRRAANSAKALSRQLTLLDRMRTAGNEPAVVLRNAMDQGVLDIRYLRVKA